MPALQVKDCPEHIYESLRTCAAEENRSISQQALTIIQRYLEMRESAGDVELLSPSIRRPSYASEAATTDYVEKRKAIFERMAELKPIPVSRKSPAAAEILRQIREEEAR